MRVSYSLSLRGEGLPAKPLRMPWIMLSKSKLIPGAFRLRPMKLPKASETFTISSCDIASEVVEGADGDLSAGVVLSGAGVVFAGTVDLLLVRDALEASS